MCGYTNNSDSLCVCACCLLLCMYPLPTPTLTPAHPAHSYSPLWSLKSLSSKTHLISQQHIQRASVPLNSQLPFLLHYHLTSSSSTLLSSSTFPTHGEGISLQTARLVYLMLMWQKDGHNGRELDAPRLGHGAMHIHYKHTVRSSFYRSITLLPSAIWSSGISGHGVYICT